MCSLKTHQVLGGKVAAHKAAATDGSVDREIVNFVGKMWKDLLDNPPIYRWFSQLEAAIYT